MVVVIEGRVLDIWSA